MSEAILPHGKHVAYDPATRDFAAYYDGELLGYRPTRPAAQALVDQHAHDLLTHTRAAPAGELAAGAQ